MGSARPEETLRHALSRQHRAFITGDVIIDLATVDIDGAPLIAIGHGCAVSTRSPRVAVYVERAQCEDFLAVLARTRRIAATFGRAPDHEAIQIKGADCTIVAAGSAELAIASAYRTRLARQFALLGLGPAGTEAYLGTPPGELAVLRFTPTAVFQQTPGPQAGAPLA